MAPTGFVGAVGLGDVVGVIGVGLGLVGVGGGGVLGDAVGVGAVGDGLTGAVGVGLGSVVPLAEPSVQFCAPVATVLPAAACTTLPSENLTVSASADTLDTT